MQSTCLQRTACDAQRATHSPLSGHAGRSATNVIGNAVATVVIAHSEGVLQPLQGAEAELAESPADVSRYGELGITGRDAEP
jgi:hypothetical protein